MLILIEMQIFGFKKHDVGSHSIKKTKHIEMKDQTFWEICKLVLG